MSRLHYAARRGLLGELKKAIAEGQELDGRTANHFTPLHLAAQEGHSAVAAALLEAGADPLLAHPNGRTALHFAASSGHLGIVRALVERGVPVDPKDRQGETPALEAALFARRDVVEFLLAHGANPDVRDRAGRMTVAQWLEAGGIPGQAGDLAEERNRRFPDKGTRDAEMVRRLMVQAASVEEYAAHHGRGTIIFSLGVEPTPDPEADRWAKRYREILADPALLAEFEDRYLEGEALAERQRLRDRQARADERRQRRDLRRAAQRIVDEGTGV